jgi:hypothetical protein
MSAQRGRAVVVADMLAPTRELEARPGAAQKKILPRNKKYSVIRSKVESDRLGTCLQYTLSVAFGDYLKTTEYFLWSGLGDFFL